MNEEKRMRWDDSRRYLKLTQYDQILSKISSSLGSGLPKTEWVRVDLTRGRVSAESIVSRVEIPARTTSAMDGYALKNEDIKSASPAQPSSLFVKGSLYPNYFSKKTPILGKGETYYVATGAPLPRGTDTVVRVEEALSRNDIIVVRHVIEKGKNIAMRGEDVRNGQTVVRKGQILDPVDVALLIGTGRTRIKVFKRPRVGLLSIGDELKAFDPDSKHNTRDGRTVNNYLNLLEGYVEHFDSEAISLGTCGDEITAIRRTILSGLLKCDVILTISGSSVGRHDNVLDAVTSVRESKTLFHGARLVPIRPSGIVRVKNKPVIIVPGHAVSAVLTFFTITLPVLNLLSGLPLDSRLFTLSVSATNEITNNRAIEALSLIRLEPLGTSGKLGAVALDWGSNLLSNLSKADGFIELAPHETIKRNQAVNVRLFDGPVLRTS